MAFEVYESKTLARRHVPVVTVQKRGAISINRAGYEALGEPEHVLLLRDVDAQLIAVKPTGAGDVHGHVVRLLNPARGSGPVVVPASDFVRDVGIDTTVARRWVAQHQDGMLIVDLNTVGVVVVSNRERARAANVEDEQPVAGERPRAAEFDATSHAVAPAHDVGPEMKEPRRRTCVRCAGG